MRYQSILILMSIAVFSITLFGVFPDAFAATAQEIVAVTVDIQTILLEPGQVIPLLDTKSVGNMTKLQVSATLPCDGSHVPKLKIIAGALGNLTGVIDSSSDYASLAGPFSTCLFSDTIAPKSNLPFLNKVFLKNDGSLSVITNLGTVVTLTGNVNSGTQWETDLSTDEGWVTIDSDNMQYNSINDNLTINVKRDDTNDVLYIDLQDSDVLNGINATNNAWALRFKLDIGTYSPVSGNIGFSIGLSSNNGGDLSAHDGIFLNANFHSTAVENFWIIEDNDGTSPDESSPDAVFVREPQAETLYVEMKRTEPNAYAVSFYSDTAYTNLLESQTGNTDGTLQGLRYLKMWNYELGSVSGADIQLTIDDIKLCNTASNFSQCTS